MPLESNTSVLLWDNASRIPPQELDSRIQFHQSRENIGFARACNQLARMTEADILLFFNPDARARPQVLMQLIKRAREKQALVAPFLLDPLQGFYRSWAPFPQRSWYGLRVLKESLSPRYQAFRVDWVMGACFAIPRDLFLESGGFSEDYFVFTEDLELCWRLQEKGIFTWIEPDLKVGHPKWGWSGARMERIAHNLNRYAQGKSLKSYLRWHRLLKNFGRMSPEDFLMLEKALCPEKYSD